MQLFRSARIFLQFPQTAHLSIPGPKSTPRTGLGSPFLNKYRLLNPMSNPCLSWTICCKIAMSSVAPEYSPGWRWEMCHARVMGWLKSALQPRTEHPSMLNERVMLPSSLTLGGLTGSLSGCGTSLNWSPEGKGMH